MEEERSPAKVDEAALTTPEGDIQPATRRQLLNMAISTYKDVMLNGKPVERKLAADAVLELLGKKGPKQATSAQFNFNIPPEYFKRVFGEGLVKLTTPAEAAEDATYEVKNG